jgi:chitin disaccharide deacetylase
MTRRLIVNADDFGRSHSINEAVIRAHREGILTSASLMTNESAFDEAVRLARENPKLGVGLHLTLLMGHSALPHEKIPGLVNERNEFSNSAAKVGFKYFFWRSLREQLRNEIHAQFEKFRRTGLLLDHVNGHLHLHLHPTIRKILLDAAEQLGIQRMRLTRESFFGDVSLARGRWFYRSMHAAIFFCLSSRSAPGFRRKKILHTPRVFGLLQDGHVTEEYILKLLPILPPGDSELYSHPSLDKFKDELDALVSPRVKAQVAALGIQRIRYQDL